MSIGSRSSRARDEYAATTVLCNQVLRVEISALGAELASLRRLGSPVEYLWQGDPALWAARREAVLARIDRVVESEARAHEPAVVLVDRQNRIVAKEVVEVAGPDRRVLA